MSSPITLKNGVVLRDPEDFDTLRRDIFDGVKAEVAASFPKSYGGVRLEVSDLQYEGPDHWTPDDQTKAIMEDGFLARKLRGTVRLFDEQTGELLDEKRHSLMRVPWLTERGTFVHGGNDYATSMQSRLVSGPYTRRTDNGLLETHFNPRPGSGRGFRLQLDPETPHFYVGVSGSRLHGYSLFKDLGYTDDELKSAWGDEVFRDNSSKYDKRVLSRAYKKLVPQFKQDPKATRDIMAEAVREALGRTEVSTSVARKTTGRNLLLQGQKSSRTGPGGRKGSRGRKGNFDGWRRQTLDLWR